MSDNIKELVKRLRDDAKRHNPHLYKDAFQWAAADALEAMAGEVKRLTSDVDALGDNMEKVVAERDRLKAALELIVTDAPAECPSMEEACSGGNYDDAWSGGVDAGCFHSAAIARKALGGDA